MNDIQKVLITREGLAELRKEHEELVQNKRPEVVERLAEARSQGDLTENSEYTAAKQDLAFIDGRIAELEQVLHEAKVVSSHPRKSIDVGCRVTLHIGKKKDTFHIVGEWEADPINKKISHSSPLGKALLGKKVGDKFSIKIGGNEKECKVLIIE